MSPVASPVTEGTVQPKAGGEPASHRHALVQSIELDEMDLHVLKMFAFSEVSFNWCHDESEV